MSENGREKVFWRESNWLKEGTFKEDYKIVPG